MHLLKTLKIIIFFFFLGTFICFSQKEIKIYGKVVSNLKPLDGAAVYFNSSMIGTTTTPEGEFTLKVKPGNYELIISFLGYHTVKYQIDTDTYKKPLLFNLKEKENVLDEIIIGSKKIKKNTYLYDNNWKNNLEIFKNDFLGRSKMAEYCEILNPKSIILNFDSRSNSLDATSKEPIKIKHNGLGYLITFDMVSFSKKGVNVTYTGYTRYENLEGTKKEKRRWKKNRRRTYKGSVTHFLKSSLNGKIYKNGYIVRQFKRKINPKRPKDIQINYAREYLRENNLPENYSIQLMGKLDNKAKTAYSIIKKSKLPRYIDDFYNNIDHNQILKKNDKGFYISPNYYLNITYRIEKEERNFIEQTSNPKRKPGNQISNLIPIKKPILINKRGQILNQKDVFYEGYWSFEKFANSLPLDYELSKNK